MMSDGGARDRVVETRTIVPPIENAPPCAEAIIVSRHGLLRHSLQKLAEPLCGRVVAYQRLDQLMLGAFAPVDGSILFLDPDPARPLIDQVGDTARRYPRLRTIVIAKSATDVSMTSAIQSGARACITQETLPEIIASILLLVASDHIVWPAQPCGLETFSRRASDQGTSDERRRRPADFEARLASLSRREVQVLHCVRDGLGNKRIANALTISDTTVRLHMRSIMRKLGAENRTQVALFAVHVAPVAG